MGLAPVIASLVNLEEQFANTVNTLNPDEEVRVYEWRPTKVPELPAIWNWIDDGTFEIVDTAKGEDRMLLGVTIAVAPSDIAENMGQLVGLFDIWKALADPVLVTRPPFGGVAKEAKRVGVHSVIDDFNGVFTLGLAMQVEVVLREVIAGHPTGH